MIRGFFVGESPFVRVRVRVLGLSTRDAAVDMLVDTGSHVTVLQYSVLESLEVGPEVVHALSRDRSRGFGGQSDLAVLHARLAFDNDDGIFRLRATAALAPDPNGDLPNVLGMDFMAPFRLTVSRNENLVELRPMF